MNYLRLLRETAGMTQKQLAERSGIDPCTLNRIERGWFTKPPRGVEERLKRVFGDQWNFQRLMQRVSLDMDAAADQTAAS